MTSAKARKTTGQHSGSGSPKPVKSWSKVAAAGPVKGTGQEPQRPTEGTMTSISTNDSLLVTLTSLIVGASLRFVRLF